MKNYTIKRILVPIDFSENSEDATLRAVTLAKLLKADVFLIHVIDFQEYIFPSILEGSLVSPSLPELKKAVEKKTEEIQKKIKEQFDIFPEVYIGTGRVHSEIISFSEQKKIDLIVMGTHGVSGYKELFIGSNSFRTVTLSEIPVLTIRNNGNNEDFKNILIPIDNSIHSREKVNIAMVMADLFRSKIHLIGLPDSEEKQELNKFNIKLESVEKIIHADHLPFTTTIVHGDNLAEAALKYADKNQCDLIVINTGHESKMYGIFLGAFAQQIVNHSKISVLSIKHLKGYFSLETPGYGID